MSIEPLNTQGCEAIKQSSEKLRDLAKSVYKREIQFDADSIEWLASVIEFARKKPEENAKKALAQCIGSFLGGGYHC